VLVFYRLLALCSRSRIASESSSPLGVKAITLAKPNSSARLSDEYNWLAYSSVALGEASLMTPAGVGKALRAKSPSPSLGSTSNKRVALGE
jgi:hypothetical protein